MIKSDCIDTKYALHKGGVFWAELTDLKSDAALLTSYKPWHIQQHWILLSEIAQGVIKLPEFKVESLKKLPYAWRKFSVASGHRYTDHRFSLSIEYSMDSNFQ